MASLLRFSVLATTTLVMACGSSVETGTGGAATTTTTTTTGAGGTGTTTSTSTSSTGSTSTGTTGTGGPCGSFGGATCGSDEYCDYSDNRCGSVEGNGTCKKRPTACPELDDPACGCDGKVYGNPCGANGAGVDVNDGGKCKPPAGKFGCGSHFCAIGLDYCEVVGSDVFGQPSSYACKPLPPLCEAPPSCACLSNVTCGDMCTEAPGGGIEVVCPGG